VHCFEVVDAPKSKAHSLTWELAMLRYVALFLLIPSVALPHAGGTLATCNLTSGVNLKIVIRRESDGTFNGSRLAECGQRAMTTEIGDRKATLACRSETAATPEHRLVIDLDSGAVSINSVDAGIVTIVDNGHCVLKDLL
jgi:hypothetical protein